MKLTPAQLYSAQEPLAQLAKMSLPVRGSLAVVRAIQAVEAALKPIDKVRTDILQTYHEKDQAGQPVRPNDLAGNPIPGQVIPTPEGQEKLIELFNTDAEVEIVPISVALLGNIDLAPRDLAQLTWLIVD